MPDPGPPRGSQLALARPWLTPVAQTPGNGHRGRSCAPVLGRELLQRVPARPSPSAPLGQVASATLAPSDRRSEAQQPRVQLVLVRGGGVFWSGWSLGFAFWELLNQHHPYATGARTARRSALTPGLDPRCAGGHAAAAREGQQGGCSCEAGGEMGGHDGSRGGLVKAFIPSGRPRFPAWGGGMLRA